MPPSSILLPPYPLLLFLFLFLSILRIAHAQPSLTAATNPLLIANPTFKPPLNRKPPSPLTHPSNPPTNTLYPQAANICRIPTCTPTCPCNYIPCPAPSPPGTLNCCNPSSESCLTNGAQRGTCCTGINQACGDKCCPAGRVCGRSLVQQGGTLVGNCCEVGKGACLTGSDCGAGEGGRCVGGCCV